MYKSHSHLQRIPRNANHENIRIKRRTKKRTDEEGKSICRSACNIL